MLCEKLTLKNPKWLENDKMCRWNKHTPEFLKFYERTADGDLIIPRGFTGQLLKLCRAKGVPFELIDQRLTLPSIEFNFNGKLKQFQKEAATATLLKHFGLLSAPTGSGKTVMALFLISQRKQPTLIIVHTLELLNQWINRIESFLDIPVDEIGIIGGGKKKIGDKITVAMIQTLCKDTSLIKNKVGHLIVDECHHIPASQSTKAVSQFDCKYMTGLTATPGRRDGLSKVIFWHIGDVVHDIDKHHLVKNGHLAKAKVYQHKTNYTTKLDPSTEYSSMLSELTQDQDRNNLITSLVIRERKTTSGIILVLSDRRKHVQKLFGLLEPSGYPVKMLTGEVPKKNRSEIITNLKNGDILVATSSLIGEGFDLPAIESIFLTTPVKYEGRLVQQIGRAMRPAQGKAHAKVYDFVDYEVGVLKHSAKIRLSIYQDQGLEVCQNEIG